MIELQAVGTALSALKSAFDLTKTIGDATGDVKARGQIIELQSKILSAQQSAMSAQEAQSELLKKIGTLEGELDRVKRWNEKTGDYRLEDVGEGAFVYSPNAEPTDQNPNYWLCVKCFESGNRSIVQKLGRSTDNRHNMFKCPACSSGFSLHWGSGPHTRVKPQPTPG